ncbi:MAG: KOW domain-containing RNA-binding protein [Clostridia bacterium]|nr:KOW domain-containing RNA-binding protein [Clostridia bacterium]
MAKAVKQGDLVKSIAGRDAGKTFLVVSVKEKFAFVVDGKTRKTVKPKKKNVKHLEKFSNVSIIELAEKIKNGIPVGNDRVYRAVKTEQQKLQED